LTDRDNTIEFDQLGIGDVLKRYRLKVPPNQREYAWTKSEVTKLLEDITSAISTDEPQHFLGSIVTIRGGKNVFEVVDGQQRLATTALVLAAMRSIVGEKHINLVKLIDGFLSSIETTSLEEKPNLTLNAADAAVFHNLIISGEAGDSLVPNRVSHQYLVEAYELAKSHLKKVISPLPEHEKWTAFQGWIEYFQHKTKVIMLIVSSEANSYKMFETLNDRGIKVSQSDLIKNYIFGESGDRINASQQCWSSIRGILEALDGDDVMMNFIRHALITTNGFLQQKNIYDKIQGTTRGPQSSVTLLSTWDSLASDYVALSNADSSFWSQFPIKIRNNVRVLILFDIAPLKPLLLAVVKKMDAKQVGLAFEKIVAIGVRLIIASRTTTQSVEKPLGDVAKQVWNEEISDCNLMIEALSKAIPNDQQFQDAFEDATVSKPQFARYYLRSLERVAKDEPDPWLIPNDDANTITLEHVLPLKPMEHWPEWEEDEVKTYSKRIGNMVLLKSQDNSEIRSKGFSIKRKHFKESPYETTSMVGAEKKWLPQNVIDRQKKLAILALKAWPLR
jgi:hypothetical protein